MSRRSTRVYLLVAGLAVILTALAGGKAVPIYDGVGFPDEPYRYVSPPPFIKTQTSPPTTALTQVSPSDVNSLNGVYVTSLESGPQAAINLGQDSLIISPQVKMIQIKAVPLAPTSQPNDGTIAGNVYQLNVTSDEGSVSIRQDKKVKTYKLIDLRLPQGEPSNPVMEYMPAGGPWQRLDTGRVGNDIYEGQIQDNGDYALVIPKQASSKLGGRHGAKIGLVVSTVAGVLIMATIVLAIRSSSKKARKK